MSTRREKKAAEEDGAIGGDTEHTEPTPDPATADPAINRMAKMFESFMEVQRARDEWLEKESSRQAHQFQVLTHQVTQLQLDVEVTRERRTIPLPTDLRELTPEPPSTPSRRPRGYEPKMAKLEDSDNIEHYLTTFERLATVFNWPEEDWAIHLIPLLTGKARSAFVAMDSEGTLDYDLLKEAVVKKYEINAETYRLQFRALETRPEETPQELYVRLKDLFCNWVKYDRSSKEDLMELIVLEQYLRVLYPEVKTWVKEHNPATAAEAAKLVENFVAAHRGPRSYRYAGMLDRQARGKSVGAGRGVGFEATPSHSGNALSPSSCKAYHVLIVVGKVIRAPLAPSGSLSTPTCV